MNQSDREKEFLACNTLASALATLKHFGCFHKTYSFYTTLDRIDEMLGEERGCMWLTRCNAEVFDDRIECCKYGKMGDQDHTFIKCFTYRQQESAAMWGLYCPPTYKAIRVSAPGKVLNSLTTSKCYEVKGKNARTKACAVKGRFISDIVYASVANKDDEIDRRSNVLYWDDVYTHRIDGLETSKDWKTSVARVKDAEWRFEDEARLIVRTRDATSEHIAIDMPQTFINGMTFTLSPWANQDEQEFVRNCLVRWLKRAGRKNVSAEDSNVFRQSVLEKALVEWAKRRGL